VNATILDGYLDNNWKTTSIKLELVHDIAIIAISPYGNNTAPVEATIGELVSINVTVANEGHYTENVNLTVSYDKKGVYIIIHNETFTLDEGLNETVSCSWDTKNFEERQYKIVANATIDEKEDRSDNTNTTYIKLNPSHDVRVVSVTPSPRSVFIGELMNIKVVVENIGGYNETFNVEVSDGTKTIKEFEQIELSPGNNKTLSFNWNTTDVSPASYLISAKAILPEGVEDANPFNNRAQAAYMVNVKLPLGAIAGTIIDSLTGDQIAGAQVIAGDYSASTNANGHYNITDVLAGTYNVTASADGYESSTKTNITVVAGQITPLNFTLTHIPTTGTIAGVVRDSSTGDPIADAIVTANDMSATTDSSGAYTISDVPAGNYTVTASAEGYESFTKTNIAVVAGETTPVDFELTPVQPLNILLYAGAAAIVIVVVATIVVYILKVKKPKPT